MYFAKVCLNSDDLFKELFQVQLGHLFMILPYSPWIAVVAKVVNIIATFCWNYMDLFVMMIGVGLSTRFRQINEDLQRTKGKVKNVRISFKSFFLKNKSNIFLANVRGFLGITSNAVSKIGRALRRC